MEQSALIFLEGTAAAKIMQLLTVEGLAFERAISIAQVIELAGCSLYLTYAVTTRLYIDTIRNVRLLPVVNAEVFFHQNSPKKSEVIFDEAAFLRRIRIVSATKVAGRSATK